MQGQNFLRRYAPDVLPHRGAPHDDCRLVHDDGDTHGVDLHRDEEESGQRRTRTQGATLLARRPTGGAPRAACYVDIHQKEKKDLKFSFRLSLCPRAFVCVDKPPPLRAARAVIE